jgi:3'(2'), 5'-bisphosphate nucleotidase
MIMINTSDPKIRFAIDAVRTAASLAGDIQQELVVAALTKDDRSPVTVADFAAQAVVGHLLDKQFPGEYLVGEEQADVLRSAEEREVLEQITHFVSRVIPAVTPEGVCDFIDRGVDEPGKKYWTLDPIDGTKGFLRGAQYATALAYVRNGEVQIGVLGCPNMSPDLKEDIGGDGALLIASRGSGSWITSLRQSGSGEVYSPIKTSTRSTPEKARVVRSFETGHTDVSKVDQFQKALGGKTDPVRMDSQVKYALLAAGIGEIYLRLLSPNRLDYKEMIWDQAAGSVIVEEAGGKVTDLDDNPLDFSQGRTLKKNRGICATNGIMHGSAIEVLKEIKA